MSEPVNLNRFRKAKARASDKARADENAVKFGRTGAEKQREKTLAERAKQRLDGHQKDDT